MVNSKQNLGLKLKMMLFVLVTIVITVASIMILEYFNLYVLMGVLLSLPIIILVIKNIKVGIYLLLCILFFTDPAPVTIGIKEIAYIALFGLVFFSFILKKLLSKVASKGNDNIYRLLTLYLAILISSFFISYYNGIILNDWIRGIIPFLNLFMFYVIIDEFRDTEQLAKLVNIFVVVAIAFAFKTYYYYFQSGIFLGNRATYNNSSATIPYPMAASIVFFCKMVFYKQKKLINGLIFIFLIGSVVVTLTRSMILSVILSLFILAYVILINRDFKKLVKPIILTTILIVFAILLLQYQGINIAVILQSVVDRFLSMLSKGQDLNISLRQQENVLSFQEFAKHPILGHGIGYKFNPLYIEYGGEKVGYTHNSILYLMVTTGMVGVLAYFSLFISSFYAFMKCFKAFNQDVEKIMSLSFLGIAIMIFIYALFFATLRSNETNILLSMIFAGAYIMNRKYKETKASVKSKEDV